MMHLSHLCAPMTTIASTCQTSRLHLIRQGSHLFSYAIILPTSLISQRFDQDGTVSVPKPSIRNLIPHMHHFCSVTDAPLAAMFLQRLNAGADPYGMELVWHPEPSFSPRPARPILRPPFLVPSAPPAPWQLPTPSAPPIPAFSMTDVERVVPIVSGPVPRDTACSICLSDDLSKMTLANVKVRKTKQCNHYFCDGCISSWLKNNRQMTCPNCRAHLSTPANP